jgi:hypothetical protein
MMPMADQILFDRLIYVDRLKRAGISEDQARAHADAMDEALRDTVATQPFVRHELLALKQELTIRMGLIAAALFAALAAIKFFG